MAGGGKSSGSSNSAASAPLPNVTAPTFTPNTTMPVGYQFPANPGALGSTATGVGTGAPGWAQGAWAMPWWGQQAPETGMAMLQAQKAGPYAPQAAAAPAAPATQQSQLDALLALRSPGTSSPQWWVPGANPYYLNWT